MKLSHLLCTCLASVLALAAEAATVVVEAVQYPAWLERGGVAAPLVPGTPLQGNDSVRTGGNARARLRFADGSTVKLGENAQFEIVQARSDGALRASLRVLEGAFRYATEKLKLSAGRSVDIRARNVSIGIRGTDLWGKSTDERGIVCLIEGAISVGSDGHPTVRLDQPLDFYESKPGLAPTVQKVSQEQLAIWALETETSDDAPVAQAGGPWLVNVASFTTRDEALALARRLRVRGFPARVTGVAPGPYAVVIAGMAGDGEALALIRAIRGVPGITSPTISR